jgi:hypothetical protein
MLRVADFCVEILFQFPESIELNLIGDIVDTQAIVLLTIPTKCLFSEHKKD